MALVPFSHHNITPPLDEQLILELEGGELSAEFFQWLLGGVVFRQVYPLDQDMPSALPKLGTQSTCWLLEATAVAQWRKGRGRCWSRPPERLEDANMKDVVDARSF